MCFVEGMKDLIGVVLWECVETGRSMKVECVGNWM